MEKNVLKNDKKQIDSDIINEYMLSTIKSIKEGIFLLKSQNITYILDMIINITFLKYLSNYLKKQK